MLVINGRNEAVEIRWLVQIVEADEGRIRYARRPVTEVKQGTSVTGLSISAQPSRYSISHNPHRYWSA
jgi:hypothetical protein